MLKANLNLNQTRPVANATLVDNNGIPYSVCHRAQITVDVYGYPVELKIEGRIYEALDQSEFVKLSYTAVGQLPSKDGEIIPYILPERYAKHIDEKTIENLVRLDVARVCNEVVRNGERYAPLNLLGAHGAKLDKKGYPVMYIEETIAVANLKDVEEGDVVSIRVLYSTSMTRAYINAYPQTKASKIHANPTIEDRNDRVSLTEQPFNAVDFFNNVTSIRAGVHELIKASNW